MAEYNEPTNLLTRDSIIHANDAHTERIEVPEWGGAVLVKRLSGAERDRFEASIQGSKTADGKLNLSNFRAKLVVLGTVDQAGGRLFGDTDVNLLGARSAVALQRVFEAIQRLAGMTKEDVAELTGNFEGEADSFDSPSA